MEHASSALRERIREKCQRDGWYGSDLDEQDQITRNVGSSPIHQRARSTCLLRKWHSVSHCLPCCALYAEVANGGFGPGGGIQGALGGYGSSYDMQAMTVVDDYDWCRQVGYTEVGHHGPVRLVDLANYEEHWKRGGGQEDPLLLPPEVWPEQLLPLDDLGCCMQACLDCKTGRVFCTAPSGNKEMTAECKDGAVRTFRNLILTSCVWPERFLPICNWGCGIEWCLDCTRGGVYRVGITKDESSLISLQAPSLDDMLERWVPLPYDSPLFVRGYEPSNCAWIASSQRQR